MIKVSEHTSFCAAFLLRPVEEALRSLGHSPALVQVITGLEETGKALVAHKDIAKIIFTGSDGVGKHIMRQASADLTPVVLELGGKDPFIVCNDVILSSTSSAKETVVNEKSLEWVVNIAMRGVFQNNGQNCIGIERIFVEESSHDMFVAKAKQAIEDLRQGVPSLLLTEEKAGAEKTGVDVGGLTVKRHLLYLEALIADAKEKGATVEVGGEMNQALSPGSFFKPTLVTNVTQSMRIFNEEVFGPIMVVSKFQDGDDRGLLEAVNSSDYGLCASVFCYDSTRAKHLSERIESGMCNINDFGINYLCQSLPFGGCKQSGFGKFAGEEGLRSCCRVKSVTLNKYGLKTELPKPFVYPLSSNAGEVGVCLVEFIYESSVLVKLSKLFSFLKELVYAD